MSKQRKLEALKQQKMKRRKRNITIAISAVLVITCIGLYFVLRPTPVNAALNENGDLVIPISELNTKPTSISYEGGSEKILAWIDSEGQVKTTFDTCQECFSLGNTHYTLQNDNLVCSSCQNTIPFEDGGISVWGGCQPVSIPVEFRADSSSDAIIPADVLAYAENVFEVWNTGDYTVSLQYYQDESN